MKLFVKDQCQDGRFELVGEGRSVAAIAVEIVERERRALAACIADEIRAFERNTGLLVESVLVQRYQGIPSDLKGVLVGTSVGQP